MIYILIALIFIAVVFLYLLLKMNNISFRGKDSKIREFVYDNELSGEIFTSDVIDDDIDDRYRENDWSEVSYYDNDFKDDNYIELFDDMLN